MLKFINLSGLLGYLFDHEGGVRKAAKIVRALLEARSARLSAIADANYKAILVRLFQEEAEFVIGDPTEIKRPQAKKTAYMGQFSDGHILGYWLFVLATIWGTGHSFPLNQLLLTNH